MNRLRPAPAVRYIHPKAAALLEQEGDHDADLELSGESAPNYLSWVAELCDTHLGHRVLEVGAGLGAITSRYEQGREVVANDVSPSCVGALRERFGGHSNVRVEDRDLRTLELEERFDSVLMVNVLEHIADDVEALRGLSRLLVPGGNVVVMSRPSMGCTARWTPRSATIAATRCGAWARCSGRRDSSRSSCAGSTSSRSPPGRRSAAATSTTPTAAGKLLSLWDRTAVPAGRFLEAHVRMPIGLNVLGIGRRPRELGWRRVE